MGFFDTGIFGESLVHLEFYIILGCYRRMQRLEETTKYAVSRLQLLPHTSTSVGKERCQSHRLKVQAQKPMLMHISWPISVHRKSSPSHRPVTAIERNNGFPGVLGGMGTRKTGTKEFREEGRSKHEMKTSITVKR